MKTLLILLASVVIAAQVGTGIALWSVRTQLKELAQQVEGAAGGSSIDAANLHKQISERLSSVERTLSGTKPVLASINEKVEEQAMLTGRALGEIIPYKLPGNVTTKIASLQVEIDGAIRVPADKVSIERMRSELVSIVDALPPWAQEEALPTLVPLRWNLEALWTIANAGNVREEDLEAFIKSMDVLLENRPIDSSDSLASTLESQSKSVEERIAAADKALALDKAAQSLKSGDTGVVAAALEGLATYTDDPQAKVVSGHLRTTLAQRLVVQAADDLRKSIGQYKGLTGVSMRQYAFARASQTAVELRLQLIAAGVRDEQLNDRLQRLHDTAQGLELKEAAAERQLAAQREAVMRMKYQKWTLSQIKRVRTFAALKKAGLPEEQARYALRQDMTKYLAPIDEGLLDIAVGQWFRKVYSNRFEELADDGKLKLVTSFASTPKMTLEALP